LCLTRELLKFIDYKIMLKLECKTTFNSAFVVSVYSYNIIAVSTYNENDILYSYKYRWAYL